VFIRLVSCIKATYNLLQTEIFWGSATNPSAGPAEDTHAPHFNSLRSCLHPQRKGNVHRTADDTQVPPVSQKVQETASVATYLSLARLYQFHINAFKFLFERRTMFETWNPCANCRESKGFRRKYSSLARISSSFSSVNPRNFDNMKQLSKIYLRF
jgi:hypothetical protein